MDGKLVPKRNINRTARKLAPEQEQFAFHNDAAFVFERGLGVVQIDRSLFAEGVVVKSGTHIVVKGAIGCKSLVANRLIANGVEVPEWNYYPGYGVAEAELLGYG